VIQQDPHLKEGEARKDKDGREGRQGIGKRGKGKEKADSKGQLRGRDGEGKRIGEAWVGLPQF